MYSQVCLEKRLERSCPSTPKEALPSLPPQEREAKTHLEFILNTKLELCGVARKRDLVPGTGLQDNSQAA